MTLPGDARPTMAQKTKRSTARAAIPHSSAGDSATTSITHLRQELLRMLRARNIQAGYRILDQAELALRSLRATDEGASDLLLLVAQWIDAGYRDYIFLDEMLAQFPPSIRPQLKVGAFLRVKMVEAFRALATNDADAAINILDVVLRLDGDLLDADLKTVAHLWQGRAHRKNADYKSALQHLTAARDLATTLPDCGALCAVIKIQQGWVLFQQGDTKSGLALLQQAEDALVKTDHTIAKGNIESARGRIIRRQGDYAGALECFDRAIALYAADYPNHPNLARALTNAGFVKRLLALQLRKNIDARTQQTNTIPPGDVNRGARDPHLRELRRLHQELYRSAIVQLERAKEICLLHAHHSGLGSALVNAGHLHLDIGDVELARSEAEQAYLLGTKTQSSLLMARARILLALTENSHVNEWLGDSRNAPRHAMNAKRFCIEAIELARHTENKRLLMNAYLAQGEVACNEFFRDWSLARQSADLASELLVPSDADYAVEELSALKTKLLRAVGIDDTLRSWSEGVVVGKTFKEVTEEFAQIVIPRIWIREDRKVSRVARKLSMSPQKVRRLLKRSGVAKADVAE